MSRDTQDAAAYDHRESAMQAMASMRDYRH